MKSRKCCISTVEIVSPSIEDMIKHDTDRVKKFVPIFVSTMVQIARQHGCEMILPSLYCPKFTFPKTSDLAEVDVFTKVLECFLKQLEIRSIDLTNQEGQEISCRIIADYETLSIAELNDDEDLRPSISSIDRISRRIPPQENTIIVGDEFYKVIESLPVLREQYLLESKGEILRDKIPYAVYQLSRPVT